MDQRFFEYSLPYIHPIRIGNTLQSVRRGILIRIEDESGNVGWGEAAPLEGYGPDTLEQVRDALGGPEEEHPASLRFGMDCAWKSISAQQNQRSFAHEIGPLQRSVLDNTRLISTPEGVLPVSVKTKVGGVAIERDVIRVASILAALPSGGRLRLDANGIWSEDEARSFAGSLLKQYPAAPSMIEFIEEPWSDCFLSDSVANYPFAVAIDENFHPADPSWEKAQFAVIKPSLFGTIEDLFAAEKMLTRAGKKVILSSAFETGVAMCALVALASRIVGAAVGYGTYRYLAEDVSRGNSYLMKPVLRVNEMPDRPGIHIDISRLTRL